MIKNILALALCAFTLISCSSTNEPGTPTPVIPQEPNSKDQLIPLALGNKWFYDTELVGIYGSLFRIDSIIEVTRLPYYETVGGTPQLRDTTFWYIGNNGLDARGVSTDGIMVGQVATDGTRRYVNYLFTLAKNPVVGSKININGQSFTWLQPQDVQTPAGTFTACPVLNNDGTFYYYYFARGIGLVQTRATSEFMKLTSRTIK